MSPKMIYAEIEESLLSILQKLSGKYVTAYQVVLFLKESEPAVYEKLVVSYQTNPKVQMGAGSGEHYSPASFIGGALSNLTKKHSCLNQAVFYSKNLFIGVIEPGFTGNEIGIWAWLQNP